MILEQQLSFEKSFEERGRQTILCDLDFKKNRLSDKFQEGIVRTMKLLLSDPLVMANDPTASNALDSAVPSILDSTWLLQSFPNIEKVILYKTPSGTNSTIAFTWKAGGVEVMSAVLEVANKLRGFIRGTDKAMGTANVYRRSMLMDKQRQARDSAIAERQALGDITNKEKELKGILKKSDAANVSRMSTANLKRARDAGNNATAGAPGSALWGFFKAKEKPKPKHEQKSEIRHANFGFYFTDGQTKAVYYAPKLKRFLQSADDDDEADEAGDGGSGMNDQSMMGTSVYDQENMSMFN